MTARMPSAYGRHKRTENGGWGAQKGRHHQWSVSTGKGGIAVHPKAAAAGRGGEVTPPTQARPQERVHVHRRTVPSLGSQSCGRDHLCMQDAIEGKKEMEGTGRGGACGSLQGLGGLGKKEKTRKHKGCGPACLSACLPACLLGNELPPAYIHGLLIIHACMHAYIHTDTHLHAYAASRTAERDRDRERERDGEEVTRAGSFRCRANKPESSISYRSGVRRLAPPPSPSPNAYLA